MTNALSVVSGRDYWLTACSNGGTSKVDWTPINKAGAAISATDICFGVGFIQPENITGAYRHANIRRHKIASTGSLNAYGPAKFGDYVLTRLR